MTDIKQQVEPVAWMRDAGEPSLSTMAYCIPETVRQVWLKANPMQVERYTIPLYAYPPRITAEQVAELKRLADEYAEWSAAHAETFDSEYEGPYSRKESLAAEKAARAALHAALDALHTKGEA